jgi:tRNA pseudouridine13 synthase
LLAPPTAFDLPTITADLPGIGGRLRASPDHFVVEEIPLYEPAGEGTHLYANLTRAGASTRDVQAQLERLFGLGRDEVGYAGLKDKAARTTQTFSIPVRAPRPGVEEEMAQRIRDELPVAVNWAALHRNKLKVGHLLGNRFRIVVTNLALPVEAALAAAEPIAARLRAQGAPNFFGAQRFGGQGDNARQGYDILTGRRGPRDKWLRKFLLSAYQSYLCNLYLARRIEVGAFTRLLAGDVAKKHATGGLFDVEDLAAEQARFAAQEISFAAPMFGAKMRPARAEAGELEAAVLAETGLTDRHWQAARMEGTRRLGRMLLPDLRVSAAGDEAGTGAAAGIAVEFTLPKGGFATVVLREFMKLESDDLPAPEAGGIDGVDGVDDA